MGSRVCRVVTAMICLVVAVLVASSHSEQFEETVKPPMRGSIALTLGSPAGLNLTILRFSQAGWGGVVSGGYIEGEANDHVGGIFVGGVRGVRPGKNSYTAVSLGVGYSEIVDGSDKDTWAYIGCNYHWKWKFVYTEIGLTVGSGDFTNPSGSVQLGISLWTLR